MLGTVLGALKKMGAVNPTQTDDLLFRIFVAAYSLNMILHMKTSKFLRPLNFLKNYDKRFLKDDLIS